MVNVEFLYINIFYKVYHFNACVSISFADMYSFDSNIENAQLTYEAVCEAYLKLFQFLDVPVIKGVFF